MLISEQYAFDCIIERVRKDGEYKTRLFATLLIFSSFAQNDLEDLQVEESVVNFLHIKRSCGLVPYNYIFAEEIPGRLEKLSLSQKQPNHVLNFLSVEPNGVEECGKYSLQINEDENNPLLSMLKEKTDPRVYNEQTVYKFDYGQFTLSNGRLSANVETWCAFAQSIDEKSLCALEEKLVAIQNCVLIKSLKGSYCVEDRGSKINALLEFRDKVLFNEGFFKQFTGGRSTLKTQQYFRFFANRVNAWIDVLKSEDNIDASKWAQMQNDINEILLIYDFKDQKKSFSYKKRVVNLSQIELQQILNCLSGGGKSEDELKETIMAIPAVDLLQLSKAQLDELMKINSQSVEELVDQLSKVSAFSVRIVNSVDRKNRAHNFLQEYLPLFTFVCPLNFRYSKSEQETSLGSATSKYIRDKLSLNTDKWSNYSVSDCKEFYYSYKENKGILCFSDRKEKASKLIYHSFRVFIISISVASVLVRVFGAVCNRFGWLQNTKNAQFAFATSIAISNLLLVLFFIDVVTMRIGAFFTSAVIASAKCIDQYLFGKVLSKTFTFVRLCLTAVYDSIYNFSSDICKNVGEKGLLVGVRKTFANRQMLDSIKNTHKNFFNFLDDFLIEYSKTEVSVLPETWTFNVFNLYESAHKIYHLYSHKTGLGINMLLIHLLTHKSWQKRQEGQMENLNLHKAYMNFLLRMDSEKLSSDVSKFFKENSNCPEVKEFFKMLKDDSLLSEAITNEENFVFDFRQYIQNLIVKCIKNNQFSVVDPKKEARAINSTKWALTALHSFNIGSTLKMHEGAASYVSLYNEATNTLVACINGKVSTPLPLLEMQFQNIYSLLKDLYIKTDQPIPGELRNFAQTFDINEFPDCDEEVDNQISSIVTYVQMERGLISLWTWLCNEFKNFVNDLFSVTTLAHIPLSGLVIKYGLDGVILNPNPTGSISNGIRDKLTNNNIAYEVLGYHMYATCTKDQQSQAEEVALLFSSELHSMKNGYIIIAVNQERNKSSWYIIQSNINFCFWALYNILYVGKIVKCFSSYAKSECKSCGEPSCLISDCCCENFTSSTTCLNA